MLFREARDGDAAEGELAVVLGEELGGERADDGVHELRSALRRLCSTLPLGDRGSSATNSIARGTM